MTASCAHLRIVYRPVGGTTIGWTARWICELCGHEFMPAPTAAVPAPPVSKGKRPALVFCIQGVDTPIEVEPDEPLRDARDRAVVASGNAGRSDWVIRSLSGVTLPPDQKVERFNFAADERLYLMPAVGSDAATPAPPEEE